MLALLNQLAVSFDLPILDWIQAHLQCGFLDAVMPIVTLFGEGGIFWIAWAVLMLVFPKTRKTGIAMAIALVMGVLICNVTLKPLVARPRPYDFQYENFGITIKLLIDAQHDYSFPSGHTIASFEAAIPLMIYDKRMGIPAMVIAVLVTAVPVRPLPDRRDLLHHRRNRLCLHRKRAGRKNCPAPSRTGEREIRELSFLEAYPDWVCFLSLFALASGEKNRYNDKKGAG